MYKDDRKHVVIDQGKEKKRASKKKRKDRQYHIQDNADVAHKDVKMYYDTKLLPTLLFFGSHTNPYG